MNVNRHGDFVNLHSTPPANTPVTSLFVYGTLQQGECRQQYWPHQPIQVRSASIQGSLFDLGPYPAVLEGSEQVLGECWTFAAEQMQRTLEVLDRIECFGQEDVDLYIRHVVGCQLTAGAWIDAYAYFLADSSMVRPDQRVAPGNDGFCRWASRRIG